MHTMQTLSNLCVALNQVFASNKQCRGKSSILSKVGLIRSAATNAFRLISELDIHISLSITSIKTGYTANQLGIQEVSQL